jgi:hypothetical protein
VDEAVTGLVLVSQPLPNEDDSGCAIAEISAVGKLKV